MSKNKHPSTNAVTGKSKQLWSFREKIAGENLYNIIIEGSLRAVNRTRKLK